MDADTFEITYILHGEEYNTTVERYHPFGDQYPRLRAVHHFPWGSDLVIILYYDPEEKQITWYQVNDPKAEIVKAIANAVRRKLCP